MTAPLKDIRVLDASSFISGPFAAMMLSDFGATVIKVESKAGDGLLRWGRTIDGQGIVYTNFNRGKTVGALDLKSDAGRARFIALAKEADVVITNWRPGVAERLRLVEPLSEMASLIWLQISGWGPDGPIAHQPAFDGSLQARSGFAWVQGDDDPVLARMFLADKLTAMFATQSILTALYEREKTGRGGLIQLPMLDAVSYFNFPDLLQNRTQVEGAPESARNEMAMANRPIRTSDGAMVVSVVGVKQLRGLLDAVCRPDAIDQFKQCTSAHEIAALLVSICSEVCIQRTTSEWLEIFDRHDVPVSPVLDLDAHLQDPQVVHNGTYSVLEDPVLGSLRWARYPARTRNDKDRGVANAVQRVDDDALAWPATGAAR